MPKALRVAFIVLIMATLWVALASIDAGPAGLGVILSLLALLDVVSGKFQKNNKMVWLVVSFMGLVFAAVAIGSTMMVAAGPSGKQPLYIMGTALALILPLAYILIGRGQKLR